MIKKTILFVLGFALLSSLGAQSSLSWKKHMKLANQLFAQGDFAGAAVNYEQAWEKKSKKKELIFKAGECYYNLKDYRKAAEAYQHVKNENESFPLVGLKYARSLKQDGQYDKAAEEFRIFEDNYTGQSKAILQDIINTEIRGCELGKNAPTQTNRDIHLELLGPGVNSDDNEFAPFPGSANEIYFSSAMGGTARIYNSRRAGANWSKATIPSNFPVIQNSHFCNGSFSPDGVRYYFTICNSDRGWNDLTARCEIFMTRRSTTGWGQPERLPDYINMKGVTATHPSIAHVNGQELLFFVSNRDGGRGGMDLWYATRDLGVNSIDFTFPANLGPTVNTLGDEISPYFDAQEGSLYFSSNGQVSIGGFDIFRSQGEESNWTLPTNVGLPLNSSADDYFFAKSYDRTGGFLVSNRVFGGVKNNTLHSDIFSFYVGEAGARIMLEANVYDQATSAPLSSYTVNLYQIFEDGSETLLINKAFNTSSYNFELLPNRRFRVEISSPGYSTAGYEFTTDDPNAYSYGQPAFLRKQTYQPPTANNPAPSNPAAGSSGPLPLLAGTSPGTTYSSRGTSPNDNYEYTSNAPRYRGTYYKIQLVAVSRFSVDNFRDVQHFGRIDTEEIISRNLIRVLVGDFFSEQEALSARNQIQRKGYEKAYVVKYEDGVRYGRYNF